MSFTRVNPGSWAVGDPLTSAQMNQLDVDHSSALNGGTAPVTLTDSIFSQIGFGTGGSLTTTGPGQIVSDSADGIVSQIATGIQVAAAGGVTTTVDGGIQLGGSASDWVTYGTTRTYTYWQSFLCGGGNSALFGFNGDLLSGLAFSVSTAAFPVVRSYQNAFLTKATLYMAVGSSHSSVPAFFPKFGVFQRSVTGNLGVTPVAPLALISTGGGYVSFTAGSGPAWFDGGVVQALDFIPTVNNQIDNTINQYFISLADESGTGSSSGNLYFGVKMIFSTIFNSQPG